MKSVYVVGGDKLVIKMFSDAGYAVCDELGQYALDRFEKNLVCFTGGEDVSPYLYGEENISSHCNPIRDEFEREVYEQFVGRAPFVGICRGGQFLNVMNGGKMLQHIDDHSYRKHKVTLFKDGRPSGEQKVLGDHHQAMLETEESVILAWGPDEEGEFQCNEACFYRDTKSLCFQPHPEWGHEPTRELFFKLIGEYLDV